MHSASRATRAFVVLVVLLLAFSMNGCKYTDILTEHLETADATVDESIDPQYQNNPEAPDDPTKEVSTLSDSDTLDTEVATLPHYDPDAPDNGPTKRLKHSDETPHDDQAAQGEEQSGSTAASTGEGGESGLDEGMGEDLASDEADADGSESTTGGAGGDTNIISPDGTQGDPATGTVAAVGTYATITQMLGGPGGLVAADENWLASMRAAGAFTSEGDELENVRTGWSGDGTGNGSTLVDELCDTIKPQIVLYDGASPNLSADDIARLKSAGIKVTDGSDAALPQLPKLNEYHTRDSDVVNAVVQVASILSGVDGVGANAAERREQWVTYHHDILKSCYDAGKGASGKPGYALKYSDVLASRTQPYQDLATIHQSVNDLNQNTDNRVTTVYVDSMLDFTGTLKMNQHKTVGGESAVPLNHDGSTVNVNGIARSVASASDDYMVIDYYLQMAGIVNNSYSGSKPAQGKWSVLMAGVAEGLNLGSSGYENRTGDDSALWYEPDSTGIAKNWVSLGDATFSVALVNGESEADIAQKLVSSASDANGLYHMDNPYQVVTVPCGLAGSWSRGNPESFLISIWAYRFTVQQDQRDSVLNNAAQKTGDYYRYFYRCANWSGAMKNWNTLKNAG